MHPVLPIRRGEAAVRYLMAGAPPAVPLNVEGIDVTDYPIFRHPQVCDEAIEAIALHVKSKLDLATCGAGGGCYSIWA